jgi:hypothetical protein
LRSPILVGYHRVVHRDDQLARVNLINNQDVQHPNYRIADDIGYY